VYRGSAEIVTFSRPQVQDAVRCGIQFSEYDLKDFR
jgi:hypothetical protein